MNILVISQYYYPEQFKINDICERLVENGHVVKVLTGLPNYPVGDIFNDYKQGRNRRETINGVDVVRSYLVGRGSGSLRLALNYLSFMVSSSLKALFLKEKFDLVFVYQLSPVLMAIAGIIYKRKQHVPLYLYCLDLWPESIKVNIKNENSIVFKAVRNISGSIYKQCDKIGVTSQPFIHYLNNVHGIEVEKITYLPQHGYDLFSKMGKESIDHEGINISYFGNIGKAQDFDSIINNIENIDSNIYFHIIGDGSEFNSLKQKIDQLDLGHRIRLHGYKKAEALVELYKLTDICFLTLKPNSMIGDTLPSKMIEYLSVAKPILAIARGSVESLIHESKCGYSVEYGNDADFVDKMKLLSNDAQLRRDMGQNGRAYFENNFTKERFITKIESQLYDLVGGTTNV